MKRTIVAALLLTGTLLSVSAGAQMAKNEKTVKVGGAAMHPSKNIIENAMNSKNHTTLVAAVQAAGLVETLQGPGPFTVFAPTNAAFDALPAGTVDALVKPENKATLTGILTYHVVPGRISSQDLAKWVEKGAGTYEMTTVQGGKLWVVAKDGKLWLKDEKGGMANISTTDVMQSNGIIHVVDNVLMPK